MTLEDAKELVFREKPVFAKIYQTYRNKTWIAYAREQFPKTGLRGEHKNELLRAFRKLLLPLIGKEKTGRAADTLEKTGFASSADHHGVLWHPFFSNSALLRSHPDILAPDGSVIVLSCGGISLTNSSYPRGVFFHDADLQEIRLSFASLHTRRRSVYGHPPLSKKKFEQEIHKIHIPTLSDKARQRLWDFLKTVSGILQQQVRFSDELTTINDILWETLFGNTRGNLVYLEAESLVRTLLLDVHLRKNTFIHSILFDTPCRNHYLKHFDGVTGAHETEKKKGTHLFWYIDETEHVRKQLWMKGEHLATEDGTTIIPLRPDDIGAALQGFKLMPSLALCYSMLSFYYGVTLGGGFSQVQYLGSMKHAFESLITQSSSTSPNDTRTDIFTGECIMVGIGNDQTSIPATLVDILLWSGNDRGSIIDRQLQEITVGKSLDLMMPEFIRIITGKQQAPEHMPVPPTTFHV